MQYRRSAAIFILLTACESSTPGAAKPPGASPEDTPDAGPNRGDSGTTPDKPTVEADDPRSIFGSWKAVPIDLSSSASIVGVAPLDATHVWVALLNGGSFSVRMWNGSSWGQPVDLPGVTSQRSSGYGIRLVGKGQVWAYGPGILYRLEEGKWLDLSNKLARDGTWEADGILAVGGWGDEAFLAAQSSGYRWSKGTLKLEPDRPYADVIFGTSPSDAWAFKEKPFGVGGPAIYRNKGSGWNLLDFGDAGDLTYPNGSYGGAASLTPGNVWALGNNEVMREEGEGFKKVTRPSSDESDLYKVVWTTGPNNTWVLGNVAYHWDGKAWTNAESDLKGTYYGVGGLAPDVVWAYGATNGTWSLHKLVPK